MTAPTHAEITAAIQAGDAETAESLAREAVAAYPDHPGPISLLAVVLGQGEKSEEALELLDRVVKLDPNEPKHWCNRANVLKNLGRDGDAIESYERAIEADPNHELARFNLGALYLESTRFEESIASYEKLVELGSDSVETAFNLALAYESVGRLEEAFVVCDRANSAHPGQRLMVDKLGQLCRRTKRFEQAADHFETLFEMDPTRADLPHLIASCRGEQVERASDDYVRTLFDGCAGSFESLLSILEYDSPSVLSALVAKSAPPEGFARTLELGCGTGLMGGYLKEFSSELWGVDLSSGMLRLAANRKIYDRLEEAEITAFLDSETHEFDLIAAADVLIYFGELKAVFESVGARLAPGGIFAFTIESSPGPDPWRLAQTGRFAHTNEYIDELADGVGFETVHREAGTLRKQEGEAVSGTYFLFRA